METVRATNAKQVFDQVLEKLASAIFTKAGYITAPAASSEDVRRALMGAAQDALEGTGGANQQAIDDLNMFLDTQTRLHQKTTLGELLRKYDASPYGWRNVDTLLVVAQLVAAQKATLSYAGQRIAATDPRAYELLTSLKAAEQVTLEQRVRASDRLLKQAADIIGEFCDERIPANDEDALVQRIVVELEKAKDHCGTLNREKYVGIREYPYPGSSVIEKGVSAINAVLAQRSQPTVLLKAIGEAGDDLLDYAEDIEAVDEFFSRQQRLFDDAVKMLGVAQQDGFYLSSSESAQDAIAKTREILTLEEPYRRISELPALRKQFEEAHLTLVKAKRNELLDVVRTGREELAAYASQQGEFVETAKRAVADAGRIRDSLETQIHAAETASVLDSLKVRFETWCDQSYAAVDKAVETARAQKAREVVVKATTESGETVTHVHQTHAPAPKPEPKVKAVKRTDVCARKVLSTEADVDAYLAEVREKLLAELANVDSIRLG